MTSAFGGELDHFRIHVDADRARHLLDAAPMTSPIPAPDIDEPRASRAPTPARDVLGGRPEQAGDELESFSRSGPAADDVAGVFRHGTSALVALVGGDLQLLRRRVLDLVGSVQGLPIDAAVSYYGVKIDPHLGEADRLECPLLMHFAENDPHVPAETVAAIQARLGGLGNVSIHIYPGTGHGFNRQGYPPYNEAAATQARQRTIAHFRRLLS